MQGSVFGGHAPVVGSHVYVLQPGTGGIGSVATSLLGASGQTSASGYAITANTSDPNVPAGAKYVTTDSTGSFSLTGGYTCTAGQPVYLYSYGGGSPSTQPPTTNKNGNPTLTTADISQIVVSNAVTNNANGTATYAITLSSNEQLTAGESVTIAGLTGNLAVLDGAQTVLASPAPTATTFSVTASDVYGSYNYIFFIGEGTYYDSVANGTYTSGSGPAGNNGGGNDNGGGLAINGDTGTGTGPFGTGGTAAGDTYTSVATTSPIVELATLGVCPSNLSSTTGNFSTGSTALSYVYINEVSTVATAYTFQPFTSSSNNNAWDIGSSGTTQGLLGIDNAARTAAQLYDIQGTAGISTSQDGEGHIANSSTMSSSGTPNAGNGTVPQARIDTLANVLAACLDSTPGTGGLLSTQCNALFSVATDNGQTTGTQPTDIATAAINIARYPAGNSSGSVDPTYAADIFGISSGTVPYVPQLTSAPNDWTLAITYTGGGITETSGYAPHSIAVDASGDVFNANYTSSTFTELSPLGIPAATAGVGTGLNGPDSVALDSTSTHVWLANSNARTVSRCTTAGGSCVATSINRTEPQDAEIDGSGNIWVTSSGGNGGGGGGGANTPALTEVSSANTPAVQGSVTAGLNTPIGVAIDEGPTGDIWLADNGGNYVSNCTQTGRAGLACTETRNNTANAPVGTAIDNGGNVWISNSNGTVSAVSNAGTALTGSPFTIGASFADGVAIDGNDNVWVTGTNNYGLYVLSSGGAISPSSGYQPAGTYEPDGVAIDPSGNVWYSSSNNNVVVEVVGAAAPTVTPLSYAVANSKLGTTP